MTETLQEEEDTSLDSFFAKKDKSKKPKKKKTKKSDETVQGMPEQSKSQGDDWKDFEERKEKDYSNLKIQNLQVMEESKEDAIEESDDKDFEDEDGVKKKGNDGKWNIPTATPSVQAPPEQPELPGTQNVVGGKYVPPSVKRSAMLGMGSSSASRKPLAAPDIQSKAAFPTLSAANQDLSTPNRSADFEVVKRGIRTNEARVDDNKPRLDLGNRYDSLRH